MANTPKALLWADVKTPTFSNSPAYSPTNTLIKRGFTLIIAHA